MIRWPNDPRRSIGSERNSSRHEGRRVENEPAGCQWSVRAASFGAFDERECHVPFRPSQRCRQSHMPVHCAMFRRRTCRSSRTRVIREHIRADEEHHGLARGRARARGIEAKEAIEAQLVRTGAGVAKLLLHFGTRSACPNIARGLISTFLSNQGIFGYVALGLLHPVPGIAF